MAEIETRDIELRLDDLAERTVRGIAVPYNEGADIGGQYVERFVPGAIDSVEDVKIFYGHDHKSLPVGLAISGRDTEAGYEVVAKISDTTLGNDVLTLMRDGVLNKFSVGFLPIEQTRDGNTVTRTKIALRELSVVNWPAFDNAIITDVRDEQEPEAIAEAETADELNPNESESLVSENTELDVRAIETEVAELRRVVEASVAPAAPVAPSFMKYRSQGEFAKALAMGDTDAENLVRTYAAATTADTFLAPGFVGFINNLINSNRPSWNVWSRGALPADGLTVEFAKVTTNGAAVAVQTTENTAIAQGNIVIDSVSAPVKTYAGETTLSRQLVERSSVPYLDTAFQALSIAYANTTNAAVIAALGALDMTGKIMDADGGTAKSILEGITDGAKYIKVNSGLNAEFLLVSADAYKYLISVVDTAGRPIVRVDGGTPTGESIGSATPTALTGSIFGLPVIVDPTLSTGQVFMANSNALRVYESGGAPVTLTDTMSGQSTLSNNYAVYGYAAITVPFESAIVKLDITA
jgi:HK97 family phage prohead protease/HK97 family phage major capsid protein